MNLGIAGIHTNIGKTICSAVLVEALGFDYWKPVQAGSLDETDSMWVKQHISNTQSVIFPERHLLKLAASPHWAAEKENIEIKADAQNAQLLSTESLKSGLWKIKVDWNVAGKDYYKEQGLVLN